MESVGQVLHLSVTHKSADHREVLAQDLRSQVTSLCHLAIFTEVHCVSRNYCGV